MRWSWKAGWSTRSCTEICIVGEHWLLQAPCGPWTSTVHISFQPRVWWSHVSCLELAIWQAYLYYAICKAPVHWQPTLSSVPRHWRNRKSMPPLSSCPGTLPPKQNLVCLFCCSVLLLAKMYCFEHNSEGNLASQLQSWDFSKGLFYFLFYLQVNVGWWTPWWRALGCSPISSFALWSSAFPRSKVGR